MGLGNFFLSEEPSIFEKMAFIIKTKGDTGAYGEYLTKYMFGSVRINGYHKELCNIYVPYKESTSEIDILVLHEKGIFVLESKNYSGWIFGSEKQTKWTQMLNKNTKEQFYNPIKQNRTHINALSKYLNIDKSKMKSIIVFSERCELKKVPLDTDEYIIIKRDKLVEIIKKETETEETKFSTEEVDNIYNRLFLLSQASEVTKQQHIIDINKRLDEKEKQPTIKNDEKTMLQQ